MVRGIIMSQGMEWNVLHSYLVLQQFSMKSKSSDTISQFSMESYTSADSKDPVYIAAGDIRRRLSENLAVPKTKFEVNLWMLHV